MSAKKVFYGMIGLICVLAISIIVCAYFGSKLISQQGTKLAELKSQNTAIEAQRSSLIQAKKDAEQYEELNVIARSVVPQDKDQARTVREINKIASETGIKLKTIAFQASNLGQAAGGAPATTPPPEGSSPASPTPAAEPGQAAAAPTAPPISQVSPVQGIPGVFSLPITISTPDDEPVSYRNFLLFLERLESNRRTAHVDQIAITPTSNGSALTFTLTLNAYLRQ